MTAQEILIRPCINYSCMNNNLMLPGGGGGGRAREPGEVCVQLDAQHPLLDVSAADPLASLYHTGAAARWRRKHDDYFSASNTHVLTAVRHRPMEEVHGVDVSWTHHPGKSQGTSLLTHFPCALQTLAPGSHGISGRGLTALHRIPPQDELDLTHRFEPHSSAESFPSQPYDPPFPRWPLLQALRQCHRRPGCCFSPDNR